MLATRGPDGDELFEPEPRALTPEQEEIEEREFEAFLRGEPAQTYSPEELARRERADEEFQAIYFGTAEPPEAAYSPEELARRERADEEFQAAFYRKQRRRAARRWRRIRPFFVALNRLRGRTRSRERRGTTARHKRAGSPGREADPDPEPDRLASLASGGRLGVGAGT